MYLVFRNHKFAGKKNCFKFFYFGALVPKVLKKISKEKKILRGSGKINRQTPSSYTIRKAGVSVSRRGIENARTRAIYWKIGKVNTVEVFLEQLFRINRAVKRLKKHINSSIDLFQELTWWFSKKFLFQ